LRVNPGGAREYALRVIDKAVEGVIGVTALHLCFGYAAGVSDKPGEYDFLTELAGCSVQQISIEAAQPKLDLSVLRKFTDKTIILGVSNLGDTAVETPGKIAETVRDALRYISSDRLQLAPTAA
jgi:5-methyltetrahydropteroyltriglutamate--homocysteine methyltransferase